MFAGWTYGRSKVVVEGDRSAGRSVVESFVRELEWAAYFQLVGCRSVVRCWLNVGLTYVLANDTLEVSTV